MNGELGERIAKLEEGFKSHSQRINKLESESEALIELKTIVKMTTALQERIHNEHSSQMNKFNETLKNIDSNLLHLNTTSEQLKSDMGGFSERITSIEKSNEESKIDVPKLMTKIITGILLLSVTLLGSFIAIKLGLK